MNVVMKSLVLLLVVLSLPASVGAELSTNRMMKIVMRNISPQVISGSFAAEPKTLYRLGRKYGRLEERPDSKSKIHGLIVVSEPKIWMINLWDKTGRLIIDPGPTYYFRASIIPPEGRGKAPPLKDFEFGREYEFLTKNNAIEGKALLEGKQYDSLMLEKEGYAIILLSHSGKTTPYRITVKHKKTIVSAFEYSEYEKDLKPKMDLFKPPEEIDIKPNR